MIFFYDHRDQTNEQALNNFLDHVRRVDLYGVELHSVKVVLIFFDFQFSVDFSLKVFYVKYSFVSF